MKYLVSFLAGAVLGTAYDYIHVWFGVLSYANPQWAGTSYWVPLEFGLSALVGCIATYQLSLRVGPLPVVRPWRMALDGALLLGAYLMTGFLVGNNFGTALALLPFVAVSLGTRPSRFVFVAAGIAGITGPLGEAMISSTGFFHYNVASPVPYWLPLLWMVAVGLVVDLAALVFSEK